MRTTTRTLGEICDDGDGEVRTGPFGSQLHESDYVDQGVPVVMPKNIRAGKIDTSEIARVSEADAERLAQHRLSAGDIVYGRRGDIGRHAFVSPREVGWLCGTGCLRITVGPRSEVQPLYLHYLLEVPETIAWIANQAIGVTMPNLNTSILRSVPISYPPGPSQRKIASILSTYDDLIEKDFRRAQILEEMALALHREWFVDFRYPGHEKTRMVESSIGLVPKGWAVSRLDEICERITDGSHHSPASVRDGLPMASVKDMGRWRLNLTRCRRISRSDFENLVKQGCMPRVNDVLIAKDGSYLEYVFALPENVEAVLLSSVAILRTNGRLRPQLLALGLREATTKARLKNYVSGVAIPRIVLKDFRRFEMLVPPEDLQERWAKIAEPMLLLCSQLDRRSELLGRTRDALLPRLISGEWDVSQLDIVVPEAVA